ncbi:MAG TPA: glycosyltransferase family 4 protein [Gemmatimonadales bacterium]|nr:glycosyltransferase family 4 protein [Gemmatimonadales bacterium]
MRVLLITDWMSGSGGAESYVSWVRDGLRAVGDDVRLLTSTAGSAADGTAEYRAYGTEAPAAQALLQIVNPFAMRRLATALREFSPDVALLNMFEHHLSPGILPVLRRVPTVLILTDYKCICPLGSKMLPDGRRCVAPAGVVCLRSGCLSLAHWVRDQPRYTLIRHGLRHIDKVITCSGWMQRELGANGVPADVLPLAVPAPGPGFHRAPAADPLFVYCGRLDLTKGVALLLEAFGRARGAAPAARLRIVGRGPERPDLERLAERLGVADAVTFRGWVPPAEVERELIDAWALVVPSLWAEPLGLVAIEALVRGVPVVASADGGLGEAIAHPSRGLVFPNGDAGALAERLEAVASRRAFPGQALSGDVVAWARETFGLERHVLALRNILSEVAGLASHR